jgi:N-acetylneuraminic acid mutarotase
MFRKEKTMKIGKRVLRIVFIATSLLTILATSDHLFASGGSWSFRAPMPTARAYVATGTIDNIIYAVGGQATNGSPLATLEVYNPNTDIWTSKTRMPTERFGHAAGVINGILYVVGGWNQRNWPGFIGIVEAYDPISDTWQTKSPMPTVRGHLAISIVNGTLYAIGGLVHGPGGCGNAIPTVETYDPFSNTWTTQMPMPTARWGVAIESVNGKIYAIGGMTTDCAEILNTVEVYDPATNTWASKTPMPTARAHASADILNGKIYVVGGQTRGYSPAVEVYDPSSDTWNSEVPLPVARGTHGSGVVNNVLYVVGGYTSETIINTVEAFTVDTTPPATTQNVPANWQPTNFIVTLTCTDNAGGSGCKETKYRVDSGAWQIGNSISITTDGDHLVEYYSVDNGGNQETTKSAHAKLDKIPPTINGSRTPAPNVNGWNNTDVTVNFTCADVLSGIDICGPAPSCQQRRSRAIPNWHCQRQSGEYGYRDREQHQH